MEGWVPELVIVGLREGVAVVVKEVIGGKGKTGVVVADYLCHIIHPEETQFAVSGRKAPISTILNEGQRAVDRHTQVRDGVNKLPRRTEQ